MLDCLIVGGGPAGLTAAVYLARYYRSVAVYTDGQSRAALIPKSHNYPGFPGGISGIELLELLKRQTEFYKVPVISSRITNLQTNGELFVASHAGGTIETRTILLATGLTDVAPPIEGIEKAVKDSIVRYCPVCDAYEATDRRIALIGGEAALSKAEFLRTYSKDVTLIWSDEDKAPEAPEDLASAGISLARDVGRIDVRDGKIQVTAGANSASFDVLYPVMGCSVGSDLAANLGADTTDVGCLIVNEHQSTTVKGLYAAGDVVSDLHQIAVATGHAAIAATHIHKILPRNPR